MTLKEFYDGRENVFAELEKYISTYKENEIAQKIINAAENIYKIESDISAITKFAIIKHLGLILFISLISAFPFSFSLGVKTSISIFMKLIGTLIFISVLFWLYLDNLSKQGDAFNNYENDIKDGNINGIKENYLYVNDIVDTIKDSEEEYRPLQIIRSIVDFYTNDKYHVIINELKEFNYYDRIVGIADILNNIFQNVENKCKDIYEKSDNNENAFLDMVFKYFDERFLNVVFNEMTICENPIINRFIVLYQCYIYLYDFVDNKTSLNIIKSFDEVKTKTTSGNGYGVVGNQVFHTLLAEHGLKLIENSKELMKA